MADHGYFSTLIWQIADRLRGPYRLPQYERVMLPMTVLRRFDCVLASTKPQVLAEHRRLDEMRRVVESSRYVHQEGDCHAGHSAIG